MKEVYKTVLLVCFLVASLPFLNSCSDDDEVKVPVELTTDLKENSVKLKPAEEVVVTITNGNGSYVVNSSNEKVAKAAVIGNVLTITAVGAGEANVTISDAANKKIELTVKVEEEVEVPVELTTDLKEKSVTLKPADEVVVTITSGNGSYVVNSSNEKVAKAAVIENVLTITAVGVGEVSVTISDAANKKIELTVKVEEPVVEPQESLAETTWVSAEKKLLGDNKESEVESATHTLFFGNDSDGTFRSVLSLKNGAGDMSQMNSFSYSYKDPNISIDNFSINGNVLEKAVRKENKIVITFTAGKEKVEVTFTKQ